MLICLDEKAREIIEEHLVPQFKYLKDSCPEAEEWYVAFTINEEDTRIVTMSTFAYVDPKAGAGKPSELTFYENTYGEETFALLSTISRILKNEEQKYHINTDDAPADNKPHTLYIFTMDK